MFTLPHALNPLIAANRTLLLNELFGTVNWVLQRFAADPQWKLRGRLGFVAVLHLLPKGFQKVRAYGFLAFRAKKAALAAIRESLGAEPPEPPPEGETAPGRVLRLTGVDVTLCPFCKAGRLAFECLLPRARDGPP